MQSTTNRFSFTILTPLLVTALISLTGCGDKPGESVNNQAATDQATQPEVLPVEKQREPEPELPPGEQFWQALQTLCEQSFPGQLTIGTEESDREFGYANLSMHVGKCRNNAIDIGFHVDEDDSRTWKLRRKDGQLSLHHRHVDERGKEDATSGYGGYAIEGGTAVRQEFPADENTGEMIPAAKTNVWAVEIVPGEMYAYELQRVEEQRMFRVVFDLQSPL